MRHERLMAEPGEGWTSSSGFTVIELIVAMIVASVLVTVALPAYGNFKDRATATSAEANLRAALPAIELYYTDNGTYTGISLEALRAYDSGVNAVMFPAASDSAYCVEATVDAATASKNGPGAEIVQGSCGSDDSETTGTDSGGGSATGGGDEKERAEKEKSNSEKKPSEKSNNGDNGAKNGNKEGAKQGSAKGKGGGRK